MIKLILALSALLVHSVFAGPIFFVGASYEDELNWYELSGNVPPYPVSAFSDGNSWAHDACDFLGQPCVGRYTSAGNTAPYGQNYAVGSAGLTSSLVGANYTVPQQIAKLIADYPGGLPAGAIVVIGAYWPNDISIPISSYGGVWAIQNWQANGSSVIPPSGEGSLTVTDSTGMFPGSTNNISINTQYGWIGPFRVNSVSGTQVIFNTNPAYANFPVQIGEIISTTASALMGFEASSSNYGTAISNLVSALPADGLLIFAISPDISLMPGYNTPQFISLNICHNTWAWYKTNIIEPFSAISGKVALWDMNQTLIDVAQNPQRFGFATIADAFWDGVHPSGAMHRIYASRFIKFLKNYANHIGTIKFKRH